MNMIRLPKLTDIFSALDISKATSLSEVTRLIECIEGVMLNMPSDQFEIPIFHYFSHNVYGREMKLKATSLVSGRIHKFANLNILSQGEASVLSIDGAMKIKAPFSYVASAGSKRLIYAHTDITWTTILGTGDKNVDNIEKEFTSL